MRNGCHEPDSASEMAHMVDASALTVNVRVFSPDAPFDPAVRGYIVDGRRAETCVLSRQTQNAAPT